MTTVNVPVGGKTFRKMLMVDTEAATYKTPQAPLVSDTEMRQQAPARRRRQPAVAQQQQQGAVPMMTSTPLRHAPTGRVLNYDEQGEQQVNAVEPTQAPQALPPPLASQAPTPEATVDRPPAVVAHVSDGERYWVAQAGRCIPPNIPSAKKKQWTKLLEQLALREPFKPTSYGELQVRNNGNNEEWNAIRGSNYLDVLRALMIDAGYEAAGLCEAVEAIKSVGIPATMLGSSLARQLYTIGHVRAHNEPGSVTYDAIPGSAPRVLRVYEH
jgi:hypothetical protein